MNSIKDITIYDIAARLHISPATVSRGLNGHPSISLKTKRKIKECAKELGYRSNAFASNLRKKCSNTIGVIVPRLNSNFMSDIIAGIEKTVSEAGYNAIISQSLETEKKEALNAVTMYNNMVDGLLVSAAYDSKNISHFEPFLKKNIPVIFFDRVLTSDLCSSITIDNFKAAYEITSHLITRGCKKLMHITGNTLCNVYLERMNGFKKALSDNNLKINSSEIIVSNLSFEAGIDLADRILKMDEIPEGIFVANDTCAASCMLELKKRGVKIPGDMLFAGFNNDPISKIVEPNLTTIDYRGFEMGEIAAKTLIGHLNHTHDINLTKSVVLRHELIIRESSNATWTRMKDIS
ncbi:MAG: LacI family DNA-binding transcriptional regulator [Bacteroidales bacterium]|nr:LacI family DNA-binding transcriptional regulator [Bacteroidales bacterium]